MHGVSPQAGAWPTEDVSAAAGWAAMLPPPDFSLRRSTITTVTLSLLPRSIAALVSTDAAMRTAALREAPFSRARLMQRMHRLVASWRAKTMPSRSR